MLTATPAFSREPDLVEVEKDLAHLEQRPRREDRWLLFMLFSIILLCGIVTVPYRSIELPRIIMFAGGIVALTVCIPLVFERHDVLILMLITYLPFGKVVPGTFGRLVPTFNATNIFLGLIMIGWAIHHGMNQERFYRRELLDGPLLGFLFLAVIALLRGMHAEKADESPVQLLFEIKRWLTSFFVYFLITNNLRSIRQGFYVLFSIALTTGFIGFMGLKEFYMDMGGARSSMERSRIMVTSGPNGQGFLFCCYIFFIIAIWWVYRKDRRFWLLLLPILACIQSMRLTFSRGAQVGFFAGFYVFVYMASRKAFVALVLVTIFFLNFPSLIPDALKGRLGSTFVRQKGDLTQRLDSSSSDRLEIWQAGLRMAWANPIAGVGYGRFKTKIGEYDARKTGKDPHNTFLAVACEMGIPALILFLVVLYLCWREGWFVFRNAGNDPVLKIFGLGFVPMLAAWCTANMFGTRFDSSEVTVQFFAAAAVLAGFRKIILYRRALGRTDPPREEVEQSVLGQPPDMMLSSEADHAQEDSPPVIRLRR